MKFPTVSWLLHGCRRAVTGMVAAPRAETKVGAGAETGLLDADSLSVDGILVTDLPPWE